MSIVLISLIAASCGSKNEEPEGILPKGYTDALDKAEGVEDFLEETKKERDKNID
jgi:hypothetical protein